MPVKSRDHGVCPRLAFDEELSHFREEVIADAVDPSPVHRAGEGGAEATVSQKRSRLGIEDPGPTVEGQRDA